MQTSSAVTRFVTILATILITCLVLMAVIVTAAQAARAETLIPLSGPPATIDGTTLKVAGGRVRLHGIIAASPLEVLPAEAAFVLSTLAGHDAVTCRPTGVCADGAASAVCTSASGRDLGGALVAAGYAKSDPGVGLYDNAQDRAHALGLGIWRRAR